MLIATWNVNSVKQRLAHLHKFLTETKPDVLCLQEIKCVDEAFPRMEVEDLGYNVAVHGQKGFNGVAILSRLPMADVTPRLPGDPDDAQSRYLEAVISVPGGRSVRVASIYLPNGNPINTEKFPYKLAWMDRLHRHAAELLSLEEPTVLAGDYNVIPEFKDVSDPEAWANDALLQPESRAAYRRLLALGYTDALRACDDRPGLYTFWDYQAGAWQKNKGIRIDHLLLSPQATDRLECVEVHKRMRALDKPSDHVPVSVTLNLPSA
jgi:exodeoxyribonuclease-3